MDEVVMFRWNFKVTIPRPSHLYDREIPNFEVDAPTEQEAQLIIEHALGVPLKNEVKYHLYYAKPV